MARGDRANHHEELDYSIDLEAISEGSDEEDKAANSFFFKEGEYGDLYKGEEDEEEDEDWKGNEDGSDESGSSSGDDTDEKMENRETSEEQEEL